MYGTSSAAITVIGTNGGDVILGDSGAVNTFEGGAGNDTLVGNTVGDVLNGGDGDDSLSGEGGNDVLDGGTGNDFLSGGGAMDTFVFSSGSDHDVITDFQNDIDTIQLLNLGLVDVSDALSRATEVGVDVVFDFGGGNTLTVQNTQISALADDIILA